MNVRCLELRQLLRWNFWLNTVGWGINTPGMESSGRKQLDPHHYDRLQSFIQWVNQEPVASLDGRMPGATQVHWRMILRLSRKAMATVAFNDRQGGRPLEGLNLRLLHPHGGSICCTIRRRPLHLLLERSAFDIASARKRNDFLLPLQLREGVPPLERLAACLLKRSPPPSPEGSPFLLAWQPQPLGLIVGYYHHTQLQLLAPVRPWQGHPNIGIAHIPMAPGGPPWRASNLCLLQADVQRVLPLLQLPNTVTKSYWRRLWRIAFSDPRVTVSIDI